MSSNVPPLRGSWKASAEKSMVSVAQSLLDLLSRPRVHREPTSAILPPTPVAASEIRTCASAAEYAH